MIKYNKINKQTKHQFIKVREDKTMENYEP